MDKWAKNTLDSNLDKFLSLKNSKPSAESVRNTHIQIVVADPRWQRIRSAFTGSWKSNPDRNVKILRLYLGNMKDPIKIRQVLNYLTGSGFRLGIIDSESISILRDEVRQAWNKLLNR